MTTTTEIPAGVRQADERLIRVTTAAGQKLRELQAREEDGAFLRVKITGGGCNGLSYKLKFVGKARQGDLLVASQGVEILIDTKSALYLRGMEMDYSDRLVAGGFKFANPNAKASCSCGESFAV